MSAIIRKHCRGILKYSLYYAVGAAVITLIFLPLGFWFCGPISPFNDDTGTAFFGAVFFGSLYVIWFPFSVVSYCFELCGFGDTIAVILGLFLDFIFWGALIYGIVEFIRHWQRQGSHEPDA